ncbi:MULTISPECIES: prepilin-type N-terminal cleavage/methylation domain-containing protein [Edwardsiella]|uniref:Prepilin peptidase dependent protein C-like C-terminal domain-containing protein n=1 Tax=Edwardsiella anguillarum TaxID=1821960 RepID=A0ABY8SFR8_9GAMM|nr:MULTISPECIES: prepilin-type N-terminal cleavage/methylation domain-containing protein [Edwardsiella]AKR76899.2 hypothetical protein AAZ33_03345 [Edwardsiella sp. LADL05-105]UOU79816.1 hypothetical protein MUN71_04150 [Edwardsiella anguillarum]WHP80952.1 hypothetical protein MQ090_03420 [Edwardsiella anguillarum]WHP84529.1 hypothetical protein MQ095_03370 [Edwardsiella anguillarum]WHP88313.1 hypothetical protein MQ088_03370 [Edwardsiella anguillarum]
MCPRGSSALQQGSTLVEVMLALLLTSVGLMGLVQTQRTLLHAQRAQEQRQEAWRYARGALAQATLPLQAPSEEGVPPGWSRTLGLRAAGSCRLLVCELTPPRGRPVSLAKLICP